MIVGLGWGSKSIMLLKSQVEVVGNRLFVKVLVGPQESFRHHPLP